MFVEDPFLQIRSHLLISTVAVFFNLHYNGQTFQITENISIACTTQKILMWVTKVVKLMHFFLILKEQNFYIKVISGI